MSTLTWQNEASLSPYPLSKSFGYDSLLIDANFIQFDGFVPTLKSISIDGESYLFEIIFDKLTKVVEVEKNDLTGVAFDVNITEDGRYLGKLVLGADALALYDTLASNVIDANIKFLPFLVKSIPSQCGVYTIDSFYGDLEFESDENIYFDVSGQDITFNAVAIPGLSDSPYLKTVNDVEPTLNNIHIVESETIKIAGNGIGLLTVSLIGSGINNLLIEQNNTIPTNPNP